MRDTYGHAITLTLFGESHGAAVGAVVSGLAAGVAVDTDFMAWGWSHDMRKRLIDCNIPQDRLPSK
ncbi:MAG: hypothetical protein RR709_06705, partial [Ruthenibacterium sp.]